MFRVNNKKHTNLALRGTIIGQFKAGCSYGQISRSLGVSTKTVGRWVNRCRYENHLNRRPQPGQPRKLDFQGRNEVVQKIVDDPFLNAAIVGREYQVNYRDWSRVIFSDEKTFQSDSHQKTHVYRPRNSRYVQRYTQPNRSSGRLTAGIWGWISIAGPGEMCLISRRLNRFSYIDILDEVLLPTMNLSYPDGNMVFMQDNNSVHTANIVKKWFQKHPEIELLPNWPANSPDLNPIVVWGQTTSGWKNVFPRNQNNLQNSIAEKWESFRGDTQYFSNLYASKTTRLQECIDNHGGPTRY